MNPDSLLTFVCGYAGSGKSTYGRMLAASLNAEFVEASDIVRAILKSDKRSDLTLKAELDQAIINSLREITSPTVVSGVRQVSILKSFPGSQVIWVSLPFLKRQERLSRRKDEKDDISLAETDRRDDQLGLGDVLDYISTYHQ